MNSKTSKFNRDLLLESKLSKFLDTIYSELKIPLKRVTNLSEQRAGVDLHFSASNKHDEYIDEKAQLHYVNKKLPTFALEISYEKDGIKHKGWLFDKSKKTTCYAFVFNIQANQSSDADLEKLIFSGADIVFVKRGRLITELSKLNLDESACIMHESRMNDEGMKRMDFGKFASMQISESYKERPCNLVVRRTFLEAISFRKIIKSK
jgi:hypothetical protein